MSKPKDSYKSLYTSYDKSNKTIYKSNITEQEKKEFLETLNSGSYEKIMNYIIYKNDNINLDITDSNNNNIYHLILSINDNKIDKDHKLLLFKSLENKKINLYISNNKDDNTPLHIICEKKYDKILKYILNKLDKLDKKIDININNNKNLSPLFVNLLRSEDNIISNKNIKLLKEKFLIDIKIENYEQEEKSKDIINNLDEKQFKDLLKKYIDDIIDKFFNKKDTELSYIEQFKNNEFNIDENFIKINQYNDTILLNEMNDQIIKDITDNNGINKTKILMDYIDKISSIYQEFFNLSTKNLNLSNENISEENNKKKISNMLYIDNKYYKEYLKDISKLSNDSKQQINNDINNLIINYKQQNNITYKSYILNVYNIIIFTQKILRILNMIYYHHTINELNKNIIINKEFKKNINENDIDYNKITNLKDDDNLKDYYNLINMIQTWRYNKTYIDDDNKTIKDLDNNDNIPYIYNNIKLLEEFNNKINTNDIDIFLDKLEDNNYNVNISKNIFDNSKDDFNTVIQQIYDIISNYNNSNKYIGFEVKDKIKDLKYPLTYSSKNDNNIYNINDDDRNRKSNNDTILGTNKYLSYNNNNNDYSTIKLFSEYENGSRIKSIDKEKNGDIKINIEKDNKHFTLKTQGLLNNISGSTLEVLNDNKQKLINEIYFNNNIYINESGQITNKYENNTFYIESSYNINKNEFISYIYYFTYFYYYLLNNDIYDNKRTKNIFNVDASNKIVSNTISIDNNIDSINNKINNIKNNIKNSNIDELNKIITKQDEYINKNNIKLKSNPNNQNLKNLNTKAIKTKTDAINNKKKLEDDIKELSTYTKVKSYFLIKQLFDNIPQFNNNILNETNFNNVFEQFNLSFTDFYNRDNIKPLLTNYDTELFKNPYNYLLGNKNIKEYYLMYNDLIKILKIIKDDTNNKYYDLYLNTLSFIIESFSEFQININPNLIKVSHFIKSLEILDKITDINYIPYFKSIYNTYILSDNINKYNDFIPNFHIVTKIKQKLFRLFNYNLNINYDFKKTKINSLYYLFNIDEQAIYEDIEITNYKFNIDNKYPDKYFDNNIYNNLIHYLNNINNLNDIDEITISIITSIYAYNIYYKFIDLLDIIQDDDVNINLILSNDQTKTIKDYERFFKKTKYKTIKEYIENKNYDVYDMLLPNDIKDNNDSILFNDNNDNNNNNNFILKEIVNDLKNISKKIHNFFIIYLDTKVKIDNINDISGGAKNKQNQYQNNNNQYQNKNNNKNNNNQYPNKNNNKNNNIDIINKYDEELLDDDNKINYDNKINIINLFNLNENIKNVNYHYFINILNYYFYKDKEISKFDDLIKESYEKKKKKNDKKIIKKKQYGGDIIIDENKKEIISILYKLYDILKKKLSESKKKTFYVDDKYNHTYTLNKNDNIKYVDNDGIMYSYHKTFININNFIESIDKDIVKEENYNENSYFIKNINNYIKKIYNLNTIIKKLKNWNSLSNLKEYLYNICNNFNKNTGLQLFLFILNIINFSIEKTINKLDEYLSFNKEHIEILKSMMTNYYISNNLYNSISILDKYYNNNIVDNLLNNYYLLPKLYINSDYILNKKLTDNENLYDNILFDYISKTINSENLATIPNIIDKSYDILSYNKIYIIEQLLSSDIEKFTDIFDINENYTNKKTLLYKILIKKLDDILISYIKKKLREKSLEYIKNMIYQSNKELVNIDISDEINKINTLQIEQNNKLLKNKDLLGIKQVNNNPLLYHNLDKNVYYQISYLNNGNYTNTLDSPSYITISTQITKLLLDHKHNYLNIDNNKNKILYYIFNNFDYSNLKIILNKLNNYATGTFGDKDKNILNMLLFDENNNGNASINILFNNINNIIKNLTNIYDTSKITFINRLKNETINDLNIIIPKNYHRVLYSSYYIILDVINNNDIIKNINIDDYSKILSNKYLTRYYKNIKNINIINVDLKDKLINYKNDIKFLINDNIIKLLNNKFFIDYIDITNKENNYNYRLVITCYIYTIYVIQEIYLKTFLKDYLKDQDIISILNQITNKDKDKDMIFTMIRTHFNIKYNKTDELSNLEISNYLDLIYTNIIKSIIVIDKTDIIEKNKSNIHSIISTYLRNYYDTINLMCDNIHRCIVNLYNANKIIDLLIKYI